jgi:hypothetical protein
VNAEFNWWLLIVGLVVGAGLVWLVVLDSRRRESDIEEIEAAREALWLSTVLDEEGIDVSPASAGRLLELHRAYLDSPPPDDPDDADGEPDPPTSRFDASSAPHDWPSSTGAVSDAGEPTVTSDTPNMAGAANPAIASDVPTQ